MVNIYIITYFPYPVITCVYFYWSISYVNPSAYYVHLYSVLTHVMDLKFNLVRAYRNNFPFTEHKT